MKRFDTTKQFDKQYSKLPAKTQLQFKRRAAQFFISPTDPQLRNHALKGKYKGYRSIDVTGDVRALFTEIDDTIILFAFIGTHSRLY